MKLSPTQITALRFLAALPDFQHPWYSLGAAVKAQTGGRLNGYRTGMSLVRRSLAHYTYYQGISCFSITDAGLRALHAATEEPAT